VVSTAGVAGSVIQQKLRYSLVEMGIPSDMAAPTSDRWPSWSNDPRRKGGTTRQMSFDNASDLI
jgi:hypothetical protein